MPSNAEIQVMRLLTAIDGAHDSAAAIEGMGNEAVTVLCEAALGTYPGIAPRARKNAVSLVGKLSHPQAEETLLLLLSDDDPDVAIRAIRSAGRRGRDDAVAELGTMLDNQAASPLIVAEAIKALAATASEDALKRLNAYRRKRGRDSPHRRSGAVRSVLRRIDAEAER